jgi:DNA polymerase III subunit gamma/tau
MSDQPNSTTIQPESSIQGHHYRVLARKYRPSTFRRMIGQEAMVRTLTNAIAAGRLAHAFILTGVRGVGKTTTARILARGLNCIGPDGTGGPTADPCGVCENCRAIAEDRHVDVLEMDAASRTGVNDIRELIDGVRYRPVSARYKVYIIDEVHMLSNNAFNALLKTLEEPPAHVKFIFATTEIRKVPVTVLSRCQRFDLRRVDAETLTRYFASIAEDERAVIAPAALALIARAADGSVRDGLSLLDQAFALAEGEVTEAQIREMLGLADRTQLFELFDRAMRGDAAGALALVADMYHAGADPVVLLQDLLELTHWLTRIKIVPQTADGPAVPEAERVRGRAMAQALPMGALARTWQMLLKGLGEAQAAPAPLQAVEMVLIRLTHAAEMPTPAELVQQLQGHGSSQGNGTEPRPGPARSAPMAPAASSFIAAEPASAGASGPDMPPNRPRAALAVGGGSFVSPAADPGAAHPGAPEAVEPEAEAAALPDPQGFSEVVALCAQRREAVLHAHLVNSVHLVRFEPGRIELRPTDKAPPNLANRLGASLTDWTDRRWVVSVSREDGEPTLAEQAAAAAERDRQAVLAHPLVAAVMQRFPGATIEAIRDLKPQVPAATVLEPMATEWSDGDGSESNNGDENP